MSLKGVLTYWQCLGRVVSFLLTNRVMLSLYALLVIVWAWGRSPAWIQEALDFVSSWWTGLAGNGRILWGVGGVVFVLLVVALILCQRCCTARKRREQYFHDNRGQSALEPVGTCDMDRFGFAEFSLLVLDWIARSSEPIVGLQGQWGTGKSSVVNMMIELFQEAFLKKKQCPWYKRLFHKSTQDMTDAAGSKTALQTLKNGGNKYAINFDALKDIKIIKFSSVEILQQGGITSSVLNAFAIDEGTDGALRDVLLAFAKCLGDGSSSLAASLGKFFLGKTPDYAKNKLIDRLRGQKYHYIVVVDDVERMLPKEVEQLLRDLRGICRLPHVTYLIPYDERELARSIAIAHGMKGDEADIDFGKHFLEKWIPIQYTVPYVDLVPYLKQEYVRLSNQFKVRSAIDPGKVEIFDLLADVLKTPRMFQCMFSKTEHVLENFAPYVNLADFLLVDAVEQCSRELYMFMQRHKEFLLAAHGLGVPEEKRLMAHGDEWKASAIERRRKILENECPRLPVDFSERILDALFDYPPYSVYSNAYGRISSRAHFDFYFSHNLNWDTVIEPSLQKKIRDSIDNFDSWKAMLLELLRDSSLVFYSYLIGLMADGSVGKEMLVKTVEIFCEFVEHQQKILHEGLMEESLNQLRNLTAEEAERFQVVNCFETIIKMSGSYRLMYEIVRFLGNAILSWIDKDKANELEKEFFSRLEHHVDCIGAATDLDLEFTQNETQRLIGSSRTFDKHLFLKIVRDALSDSENVKRISIVLPQFINWSIVPEHFVGDFQKLPMTGEILKQLKAVRLAWQGRLEEIREILKDVKFPCFPWWKEFLRIHPERIYPGLSKLPVGEDVAGDLANGIPYIVMDEDGDMEGGISPDDDSDGEEDFDGDEDPGEGEGADAAGPRSEE